jgi:hypothetical protein
MYCVHIYASMYCIHVLHPPMPILSRPAIPSTDRWPVVSRTPSAQVLSMGPNGIQGRSGYFTLESDVARWPQLAGASPGADVPRVSPVPAQMWQGRAPVAVRMWDRVSPFLVLMWGRAQGGVG